MTIRTKDKVVIKNLKMQKSSYIFLAHCIGKHIQLLYARIILKPTDRARLFVACRTADSHRVAGPQQHYANPRMMQHFWGLIADTKDTLYYVA